MRRYLFALGGIALLLLLIATATRPVLAQTPSFDPNNFHHPLNITNPYLR